MRRKSEGVLEQRVPRLVQRRRSVPGRAPSPERERWREEMKERCHERVKWRGKMWSCGEGLVQECVVCGIQVCPNHYEEVLLVDQGKKGYVCRVCIRS